MRIKLLSSTILIFCLLSIVQVRADVTLMAVRIGAEDVPGTGEFYKTAFGFTETNYLELADGLIELILTSQDGGPGLVVLSRDSDAVAEAIPHIIFGVTDIENVYTKAIAAGGVEIHGPSVMEDLGIKTAILKDPSGNTIELLERI